MTKILETDVAIIGAGTAGSYAMREIRRAGLNFLLIDHGPIGTVCARVGCMPSKVALHAGAQWKSATELARIGGAGMDKLTLDRAAAWKQLREERDGFANPTEANIRRGAGDNLIEGRARFTGPRSLLVDLNAGGSVQINSKAIIIANGSTPIVPDWLEPIKDRVVTTDQLFELETLPDSFGILGLGAIGLEMGLALARLGIEVTGSDIADTIGGMDDPQVAERAIERFGPEMTMWLKTEARLSPTDDGVLMEAPDGRKATVGLILAALGRRPNLSGLDLPAAGVQLDERGLPHFNKQTMQIGDAPVFIAGDANNSVPLMHEAVDEGQIAGFNAVRLAKDPAAKTQRFERKTNIGIAFTDPDLASVGTRYSDLDLDKVVIGSAEGKANGRTRVLHEPLGLLHVYADREDGRILGAAMLSTRGEHLAHVLAMAIERRETVESLLEVPYYHPVVEELLQSALQNAARQLELDRELPLGLRAALDDE